MRNILCILCFLCAVRSAPGRTMKDFFTAAPDRLLPLLTRENRLDCVDFRASKMKATVKNRFGENSTLEVLTERYARLQLTQASRVEMKLLLNDTDSVVCFVHTLFSPTGESKIAFYDTRWHPLVLKKYMKMPEIKEFIRDNVSHKEVRKVLQKAGVPLLSASLDEDSDTLTLRLHLDDGNPELKKELAPVVRTELLYYWREGRFVKFGQGAKK